MLRKRADIEREAGPFLRLGDEVPPEDSRDLKEGDLDEILRHRRL